MPNFIFCVHNHQPVGNFGHVIEDSYRNAYLPFLKAILKYPSIKLSFHITGYLMDWLLENHIEYIEMLREMVNKGQVEMMGGGYYEPIFAVIPPQDRVGQIRMMSDKLENVFGKRPRGMWLAERIWEPQLPLCLKEAGIEYIVVDDYHFIKAGLRKEQLTGYYITEDLGKTLKVFPGSERLRYIMPFETVDKFLENMRWVGTLGSNPAAIFADDGEKFGTWPGTHKWVYKEGWLKRFLEAVVENKELVKPVTFSEYIDDNEPLGRVYLPTTSYMEMGEWALPPEAADTYTNLINEVKTWQDGERIRRFLQGGFWRNFFAKYPEANWLHKRMLYVSVQCPVSSVQKKTDHSLLTTQHLYMAQCNDAYWHGVFGGLYMPHLRRAVYENLIKAENLAEGVRGKTTDSSQLTVHERDFNADTFDEILIRTPELNLFLSPHNGGSLIEMDYRPKYVNLSNTLSRWEEGYHNRVKGQSSEVNKGEAKSIHDLTMSKEDGLDKYLHFDKYQRVSLVDHFLKKEETLDAFKKNAHEELGDFFNKPYKRERQGLGGGWAMPAGNGKKGTEAPYTAKSQIVLSRESSGIRVEKDIFINGNDIYIKYLVTNLSMQSASPFIKVGAGGDLRFGVEFNLILPCCDGPDGFYDIREKDIENKGFGVAGEIVGIRQIDMVDKWAKMKVSFSFDKDTSFWRFPIETVSLSEAGFEKIFQGSCLLFFWDIAIDKTFETGFKIKVESI